MGAQMSAQAMAPSTPAQPAYDDYPESSGAIPSRPAWVIPAIVGVMALVLGGVIAVIALR